jgi:signal transduction histidine kinase
VLAAVSTFLVVIPTGLVIIYVFGFGEDEPQDRAAHAATVLREGAERWHDPAWHEATATELGDDDVQFVLYQDGDELYRRTDDATATDAGSSTTPPWGADRADGVVRFVEIEGTEPRLTAEIYTPLDDDNPLTTALFAAFLIGTGGAAVALAFGRPFVRPLRAAHDAVRKVTDGDLTAALPRSRVTEIDDVSTAFGAMTTELHRSLEQQAALEDERRMFIAAIAHDLRTPLFSLRGYLDGLDTGLADTPERRTRYLAVAKEKADTLERLVGDLFDYTRLEYRGQSLDRQPLDLADLLGELVDGLRPRAEAEDVALAFGSPGPPGHACPVDADRHQLARAVDNILDNAVRYTPAGGRIDVTCGTTGGTAWFTITDTGPGIAADDLPHLFQPLYRGDRSRGAGTGGTGLGLAIAHRIVTAHDGTLVAGNTPTGGASFTATLPS